MSDFDEGLGGRLAGWAGCLAGLEGLLDKPDQFSSIQLFNILACPSPDLMKGHLGARELF